MRVRYALLDIVHVAGAERGAGFRYRRGGIAQYDRAGGLLGFFKPVCVCSLSGLPFRFFVRHSKSMAEAVHAYSKWG